MQNLIDKYEAELKEVVSQMNFIKNEIDRLNNHGMELTAQANVLAGKIEVLKELEAQEKEGE